ncbi:hypothetical protein B0H13DRAFT_597348 [Mycena leptocephala]|nr:hypothetical protein B0H13DRAFT_597348 [Mycena leptocephala]
MMNTTYKAYLPRKQVEILSPIHQSRAHTRMSILEFSLSSDDSAALPMHWNTQTVDIHPAYLQRLVIQMCACSFHDARGQTKIHLHLRASGWEHSAGSASHLHPTRSRCAECTTRAYADGASRHPHTGQGGTVTTHPQLIAHLPRPRRSPLPHSRPSPASASPAHLHSAPTSRIDCLVGTSILAAHGQPRRNISARRDISSGARPQHTRSSVNTPPGRGHPPRAPPAPSHPNARAHILQRAQMDRGHAYAHKTSDSLSIHPPRSSAHTRMTHVESCIRWTRSSARAGPVSLAIHRKERRKRRSRQAKARVVGTRRLSRSRPTS